MKSQVLVSSCIIVVCCLVASCLELSTTEIIGPDGGIIEGPLGIVVEVPPGALAEETEITITMQADTPLGFNPTGNVAMFEPHGLSFAAPVRVTYPYDAELVERSEPEIALFWSSTLEGEWNALDSEVDMEAHTVTAWTEHFSYGCPGEPLACEEDFYCDGSQVMQRLSDCSTELYVTCAADFEVCVDGACLLTLGEACEVNEECETGFCVEFGTERLCTDGASGSPCDDDLDCESIDLRCAENTCHAAEGLPCMDETNCSPGAPFCVCIDDECWNKICTDGSEGDHCLIEGFWEPEHNEGGCNEIAPFCVPDHHNGPEVDEYHCHDGSRRDPCNSDDTCSGDGICLRSIEDDGMDLFWCSEGLDGDLCRDDDDCQPSAPFCVGDSWDRNGFCAQDVESECDPDVRDSCGPDEPHCIRLNDETDYHGCFAGHEGDLCTRYSDCLPEAPCCNGVFCTNDPDCSNETECDDGVDNDGDDRIDCDDVDCYGVPPCVVETACNDRWDNDDDWLTDCDDPDCVDHFLCHPEDCGDGVDNDDDERIDCEDSDCFGIAPFCTTETICNDYYDNDADGLRNCDDPDCSDHAYCIPEADCGDGVDNDLDYNIDCEDSDCFGIAPFCTTETICDDYYDNDLDGLINCDDPDCADHAHCMPEADCGDGVDNDGDNRRDCRDPDCFGIVPFCTTENACYDSEDDDADGLTDCDDPDCDGSIYC